MPQLSPINWLFLFILFWITLLFNSSITWWNTTNLYKIKKLNQNFTTIKYMW